MEYKIQSFCDLNAWKEGHGLVLEIYNITKFFPKEELYGITSQMRRCVVSITSNIAEGFSRQTSKEKVQFYSIARGSLTELQNQLIISKDIGYIKEDVFQKIFNHSVVVHKIVNGLINYSRNRIS